MTRFQHYLGTPSPKSPVAAIGAFAIALVLVPGILPGRTASRAVSLVESGHLVTKATVDRWMIELSNWSRWGKDDERGTLNLLTPARRKRALSLAKDGVSVSLSHN